MRDRGSPGRTPSGPRSQPDREREPEQAVVELEEPLVAHAEERAAVHHLLEDLAVDEARRDRLRERQIEPRPEVAAQPGPESLVPLDAEVEPEVPEPRVEGPVVLGLDRPLGAPEDRPRDEVEAPALGVPALVAVDPERALEGRPREGRIDLDPKKWADFGWMTCYAGPPQSAVKAMREGTKASNINPYSPDLINP